MGEHHRLEGSIRKRGDRGRDRPGGGQREKGPRSEGEKGAGGGVGEGRGEGGGEGGGFAGEEDGDDGEGRGQAAAGEAVAEARAGADEAPLDGAEGPAETPGGLVVGETLEVAEDEGETVLVGQAAEFLVEDGEALGAVEGGEVGVGEGLGGVGGGEFTAAEPSRRGGRCGR